MDRTGKRTLTGWLLGGLILVGGSPAGLHAQSGGAGAPADPVIAALYDRFERVSGYILTSAERVPEEDYGHRPTEEVRNMGELFTHILAAQTGYCAAAGGVPAPANARGAATGKAQIVERLRASRDFCLDVYRRVDPATLGDVINVFGEMQTRIFVLIQNIAHDNLHYGNVVTYMREVGLVPPSSDG